MIETNLNGSGDCLFSPSKTYFLRLTPTGQLIIVKRGSPKNGTVSVIAKTIGPALGTDTYTAGSNSGNISVGSFEHGVGNARLYLSSPVDESVPQTSPTAYNPNVNQYDWIVALSDNGVLSTTPTLKSNIPTEPVPPCKAWSSASPDALWCTQDYFVDLNLRFICSQIN
jgi:hypothetical protein